MMVMAAVVEVVVDQSEDDGGDYYEEDYVENVDDQKEGKHDEKTSIVVVGVEVVYQEVFS